MTWVEIARHLRERNGYVVVTHRLDGDSVRVSYSLEPGGVRVSACQIEDAVRRGVLVARDNGLIADGKPQSYELDRLLR